MNSRKRKKINTKKGISLVVAITLSAVLILTTTSFVSLALLQQKETGSELNTRQAYVSAKSALDIAKEMVESGKITLGPDGNYYYVLYYDNAGEIGVLPFTTSGDALHAINSGLYNVVGNSYIKINKNDEKCTLSAFSSENKYTADSNDKSHGDLSVKFDAVNNKILKEEFKNMRIDIGEYSTNADPSGNRFMLVGRQTNFSLLKSAYAKFWNQDANMSTIDSYFKYTPNNGGSPENEVQFKSFLETAQYPIETQFPLVFTEAVKMDSTSNRCTYKVYNDGVYFLGNYSGVNLKEVGHYSAKKVGYYLNNNTYGSDIYCKFIVIENNMAARLSGQAALKLTYLGEGQSNDVVVYMPNGSTFYTIGSNQKERTPVTYSPGYYKITSGSDLFTGTLRKVDNPTGDPACMSVIEKNLYNSLLNDNGDLRQMHAAYESESDTGKAPVSILYNNGVFNADRNNKNHFSKTLRSEYCTDWDNYSIYCGPSKAPTETGYYDMYCGESFNYLWYNIDDMIIKNGIKMNIRSNETVLTIGGDATYGEKVTVTHTNSSDKILTYTPGMPLPLGTSIKDPNRIYGASNVIEGKGNAEFWVRPYWGESSYTIKVMNEMVVKYPGCEDGYTIKRGTYTSDLPSQGINLFSSEGKNYFTSHAVEINDAKLSTVGWVDSTGTIRNGSPSDQTGKTINFTASSGALVDDTYKATVINCDFTGFTSPVNTTGSTRLKAKVVSIKGNIQGEHLFINTKEGTNNGCIVEGTPQTGIALVVEADSNLYDTTGKKIIKELKKGYYFFPTAADVDEVDILNENLWLNNYYYTDVKNTDVIGSYQVWEPTIDINFSEGGYY